jgi:hypothetical protein
MRGSGTLGVRPVMVAVKDRVGVADAKRKRAGIPAKPEEAEVGRSEQDLGGRQLDRPGTQPRVLREKVGLTLSPKTVPKHLLFEGGNGTTLLVYGRPSPNLADHTQVRFWCADVAADVSELVGRGVVFDLVEFGDFEMVDHVLTTPVGRSAWFKDPDGNTIQLVQPA